MARSDLTRELAAPTPTGIRTTWRQSLGPLEINQLSALMAAAEFGNADAYLTLAEEMEERDAHYASVLSTRKRAVMGLERKIESPTDKLRDRKITDAVRELIAAPDFGQLLPALLDALGKGYSAVELIWDTARNPWTPAYVWRDPRFFRYDPDTGQKLLLLDDVNGWAGSPLPPNRFIVHTPRLKMGLPVRGGLARLCASAFVCSKITLNGWMSYAETYGQPTRIGRYEANATDEEKALLQTALQGLGQDAYATLRQGFDLELLAAPAGASGGSTLYAALLDHLQKLISKAVLGRSDAADSTSGKLGGEQSSSEVRRDILESDAEELADAINRQLIRPFVDLNFGPQPAYPVFQFHFPETEDLTLLVTALEKLIPLGLKVEQSIIRDKLNLPDPEDEADLLGAPAAPQPAANPDPLPAVNRALNRVASPEIDPTAPLAERLGAESEPLMNDLLDPVRAALNDSGDLMGFREKLIDLYPELNAKDFAALMGQALAVADAAGMWEAQ